MGSIGASKTSKERIEFEARVNALKEPEGMKIFSDSKVNPLPYDRSMMTRTVFGAWRDKEENFEGMEDVNISDIITTQPQVQANKIKSFEGDIDTSSIKLLRIGGKYYLGDGNHRVVTALLQGKKKIRVRVYHE